MAKLNKHAEHIDTLHRMIKKEAALAQTDLTGVPGKDTKPTKVSDATETVDQNAVKPENNTPQGWEQKPETDKSTPVAVAKKASVQDLGNEVLAALEKESEAADSITGVPSKDTKPEKVSDKTETVDQNAAKPENNTPQGYEQKPSTDKSEPVAVAKKASDVTPEQMAVKVATFQLGRSFAAHLYKHGGVTLPKTASESSMQKAAGRRDFELLVAQAQEELQDEQPVAPVKTAAAHVAEPSEHEKIAAYTQQGAEFFDILYKQAQEEQEVQKSASENEALLAKIAELEAKVNSTSAVASNITKQAELEAQQKAENDFIAKVAAASASIVIKALKDEQAK